MFEFKGSKKVYQFISGILNRIISIDLNKREVISTWSKFHEKNNLYDHLSKEERIECIHFMAGDRNSKLNSRETVKNQLKGSMAEKYFINSINRSISDIFSEIAQKVQKELKDIFHEYFITSANPDIAMAKVKVRLHIEEGFRPFDEIETVLWPLNF